MSRPSTPETVVPIVGVLAVSCPVALEAQLATCFGPPHLAAGPWPFTASRYYESEMGASLQRRFFAFAPRPAGDLADLKRATCDLEALHAPQGARSVNLDPGYVSLGGLFLASCKPAPHRVHVGRGIYAELTLWYRHGWTALPWTFPDFRALTYHVFLDACRARLKPRSDHVEDGQGPSSELLQPPLEP